ncbi:11297_t:CDS:2 [Funneliformis geosporum]|nr:11297_t:CDS:2 [Funneliformis geosporum]
MIINTSLPSPSSSSSNSLKSSYFTPLNFIENTDKYYEDGEWQAFVQEDESIIGIHSIDYNVNNLTNDTLQHKSGSSASKTSLEVNPAPANNSSAVLHDDLLLNLNRMDDLQHTNSFSLTTPIPIAIPTTPSSSTVSLLASSPGSDIQIDRDNSNVWKNFLFSYARGNFNPLIIPKKPTKLNLHRRNKNASHYSKMSIQTSPLSTDNIKDIINDKDFVINEWRNISAQHMEGYSFSEHDTNIPKRRRALWKFQILNTSNDVNFTRIVALAKEHFKVSISLISLVNTTHQWFKAEDGLGCNGTTRGISFCGHAILQENGEPFVVPDTQLDWRFHKNPLVTDSPFIRFYAGAPLQTEDGHNIGTICLIDDKPRDDFTEKDCEILKDFAKVVMRELELWVDTLRLRVRNEMQQSIAEFSKFCLEIQLTNNEENGLSSNTGIVGDPIMKRCFNMAVKLMRDTLNIDFVYLLEMPSSPIISTTCSSNGFFLNSPPPDISTKYLKFLASAGPIELSSEALTASVNTSFLSYMMQHYSQGYIYQNALPPLPTLFPDDVHSGIVVPIYDDSQNAFGFLIAMTKDPLRQFEDEERVYLSNFGVNVVSEVLKRRVIVADRAKGTFISSISHELRTPLHGILASCELLEESKLNDAQSELIKTIHGCGTSLISIINSVLNFAKLESEKQDYADDQIFGENEIRRDINSTDRNNNGKKKKERVNLVKLVEEVAEACVVGQQMVTAVYSSNNYSLNKGDNDEFFRTQARRKHVSELLHPHQFQHQNKSDSLEQTEDVYVLIDIEPRDAGWCVMADDGAIKQMLMNIVGNSLKFTQKGYVLVSLTTIPCSSLCEQYKKHTRDFPSKFHALLTITDTGHGISPSFLTTNIFQPFSQENSLQVGTGLGLSIVKLLVEKMGGRLDIESEVGVGTRVRIWDKEKQRRTILEAIKEKTFVVKCTKGKLKEMVEKCLNNWFKVKQIIVEENGGDIEGDIIFINDDLDQLKRILSKVNPKLTPVVFVTSLAKHGKTADFVEKLQDEEGNFKDGKRKRKVVILSRPCGPHKLENAIVSVFSNLKLDDNAAKEVNSVQHLDDDSQPQNLKTTSNDNVLKYYNYSSSEETLISRQRSPSITPPTTPKVIIKFDDHSTEPKAQLTNVLPSRPSFNRSNTLPNIHLQSPSNREAKFLAIPKSTTPPPTLISTSLPSTYSSNKDNTLCQLKKSPSYNSLNTSNFSKRPTSGPRVLVVEDNAINRMILATFLKKRDIKFEEAENGAIGVEKFRRALEEDGRENPKRKGFDIVLMDIQMPIMNGNKATAEIRKIEYELNPKQLPKLSPLSEYPKSSLPEEDYFSTPLMTPSLFNRFPTTNDSTISGFSSYINNRYAPIPIQSTDNNLSANAQKQKNKLSYRRISHPERLSLHYNYNSLNEKSNPSKLSPPLLESKITEGSDLSPLPSPLQYSTFHSSRSLIFALTGLASEKDKNIAFESGVDGFLTKPVSLKTLEKIFKKWSERK